MRNKLITFLLALMVLASFPLSASAAEFDASQNGSISVTLVSSSADALEGAELSVFYVATVESNTEGKLIYNFTEAFEDCGFPLNAPDLTEKLSIFVSQHSVSCTKITTDSQGKASCGNLPLGLYFVKQTGAVEGFAPCTPFLVTIPLQSDSGFVYDVDASPKTDVARLISITLKKVWNTDKSTAIPTSVTVQLLHNGELVETATLNEHNDWQITYANLPESDAYSIKEVNIPKGFTATYNKKGYEFTVTNTASLAQTGQLIWPIPVLAAAGLFFLLMGLAILRKPENRHG